MKILVRAISIAAVIVSLAHAKDSTPLYDSSLGGLPVLSGMSYSPKLEYSRPTEESGCGVHPFKTEQSVDDLVTGLKSATHFYTCDDSREPTTARFTIASCTKSTTCRQSVGNMDANMKGADGVLDEMIAKDYVKNSLILHGQDMERLEAFTKFAQKKYDTKLGSQCLARFQRKTKSVCNYAFVEDTFLEHQKTCSFSIGCFNNDEVDTGIQSFEKFKEAHSDSKGKYMYDYYKYRIETKNSKQLSSDDKKLAELGDLVASDSFKSLKMEQKIEKLTNAIGLDSDGRLKDPILGYDLGTGVQKRFTTSDKFKDLVKILESKNITAKSFAEDFDNFRKKRAEAQLSSDEICNATPTFIKICSEASSILKGDKIIVDPVSAERLSTKGLVTPEALDNIKRYLGSSFDKQDFETLVNARRCIDYGISDSYGAPNMARHNSGSGGLGQSSGGMNASEYSGRVDNSDDGKATEVAGDKSSVDTLWNSATGKSTSDVALKDPETSGAKSDSAEYDTSLPGPYVPATQPAVAANNFNDLYGTSGFDAFAGKDKTKSDESTDGKSESSSDSASSAATDKTNDMLMKRLATAEENLEKLKADAAAAEEDRAKQKKVDEENSLIKDLKSQISDLKTQSAKTAQKKSDDAAAAAQARVQSDSYAKSIPFSGGSISSSRADSPAPVQAADSFDSARSSAAAAAPARSIASVAGPILTSVTNGDGSKTTTLGSGLVVTTVDGMTAEKAAQTISNRIIELNGTPFYIEEGGMVKEIIAVVKDGKVLLDDKGNPIFEKIVKGKVGDKKFAKTKDKKDRAPAAITDAADLKRDQEEKLKRERAEYLKLKNLTNEAIKTK